MIRAADVADLALLHEIVERPQRFVDGHVAVRLVADVEVDVVGAQAAQAGLARLDQVLARESNVMRRGAHAHEGLGRQDEVVAPAHQRLAEDLLGGAERIDVGGVERRHARLAADVEDARRVGDAQVAHLAETIPSADGHRAEAEDRDAQPGVAEATLSP